MPTFRGAQFPGREPVAARGAPRETRNPRRRPRPSAAVASASVQDRAVHGRMPDGRCGRRETERGLPGVSRERAETPATLRREGPSTECAARGGAGGPVPPGAQDRCGLTSRALSSP
ncbi:hypothetical protein GCM10023405_04870 [Streptomonospora salina]